MARRRVYLDGREPGPEYGDPPGDGWEVVEFPSLKGLQGFDTPPENSTQTFHHTHVMPGRVL